MTMNLVRYTVTTEKVRLPCRRLYGRLAAHGFRIGKPAYVIVEQVEADSHRHTAGQRRAVRSSRRFQPG